MFNLDNKIKMFVGYDKRESIAYHVFCQSVISNTKNPISFEPLVKESLFSNFHSHADGSNDFIYTRFLVPFLSNFSGWAIYADGDMICLGDISELWNFRNDDFAVCVVKHDYKTKFTRKYLENSNENYPRKNWSSIILWNCSHPANRILTPDFIDKSTGAFLHRFSWLDDSLIKSLPLSWNWLVSEYHNNYNAKLLHYTIGTPCFKQFHDSDMSDIWHNYYDKLNKGYDF